MLVRTELLEDDIRTKQCQFAVTLLEDDTRVKQCQFSAAMLEGDICDQRCHFSIALSSITVSLVANVADKRSFSHGFGDLKLMMMNMQLLTYY
jgi:hypothetical protein